MTSRCSMGLARVPCTRAAVPRPDPAGSKRPHVPGLMRYLSWGNRLCFLGGGVEYIWGPFCDFLTVFFISWGYPLSLRRETLKVFVQLSSQCSCEYFNHMCVTTCTSFCIILIKSVSSFSIILVFRCWPFYWFSRSFWRSWKTHPSLAETVYKYCHKSC